MYYVRRERRTIEEGETVAAKILAVAPHPRRPGFAVRYTCDAGERNAFLVANPQQAIVMGRELIQEGRLLRLTVFEDGEFIGEVAGLAPGRRVAMA